jgi:hypothetical protein
MPPLLDSALTKAYETDRARLISTKLPIITISGTFREDAKRLSGQPNNNTTEDIVLSRAHFSMALGVATQAWGDRISPNKAWIADPTNYVSPKDWSKIELTEFVGKTLARHPLLKSVKDFIDRFGRGKLPILSSITPPLLHLTEGIEHPILSFHIAAGNILAAHGKKVIQMVTDPHVRPEYVLNAHLPNTQYLVFDERTKLEFLEVAAVQHISVHPEKITVTGPPVDPRIIKARDKKVAWRSGPLKLCITTGGLGTNKAEIQTLLTQLLPLLRKQPTPYQLIVYAGTQSDIAQMVKAMAKKERVAVGNIHDHTAPLRLLYHPQILDANELLIKYAFPWAHGFISKPSGDMAYDVAASGSFLLTLAEWGVWEERVREVFEQKDISRRAEVHHILEQLETLQSGVSGTSWIERAMNHAFGIEKLFLLGAQKIVKAAENTDL